MKELNFKSILLFIACIGVFFTSCKKNELKDGSAQIVANAANQSDINVTDGYLYLKNWEVADSLVKLVSGMSDTEVKAWEQRIGFESAKSLSNKLFAEYEKIETIDEMQNFKSKYSSVLKFSDEENDNGFELKVGSTMYDQITSSTGKLRVGNVLYSKTEKGLKMSLVQDGVIKDMPFSIVSASNLKSLTITDPMNTITLLFESGWYNDGNRRMKVRVEIYPIVKEIFGDPNLPVYDVFFSYSLRMSGSKKTLFGWNDYKANMLLINPTCYLGGQSNNLRYEGRQASNDQNNVYVRFASAYGGRYVGGLYSRQLSVVAPSCSFKADKIASSGVAESYNYSFTYSGAGWSSSTLPWTDFSFSY